MGHTTARTSLPLALGPSRSLPSAYLVLRDGALSSPTSGSAATHQLLPALATTLRPRKAAAQRAIARDNRDAGILALASDRRSSPRQCARPQMPAHWARR